MDKVEYQYQELERLRFIYSYVKEHNSQVLELAEKEYTKACSERQALNEQIKLIMRYRNS